MWWSLHYDFYYLLIHHYYLLFVSCSRYWCHEGEFINFSNDWTFCFWFICWLMLPGTVTCSTRRVSPPQGGPLGNGNEYTEVLKVGSDNLQNGTFLEQKRRSQTWKNYFFFRFHSLQKTHFGGVEFLGRFVFCVFVFPWFVENGILGHKPNWHWEGGLDFFDEVLARNEEGPFLMGHILGYFGWDHIKTTDKNSRVILKAVQLDPKNLEWFMVFPYWEGIKWRVQGFFGRVLCRSFQFYSKIYTAFDERSSVLSWNCQ